MAAAVADVPRQKVRVAAAPVRIDGEEAGLVLEGEMMLTVDSETWSLKTGDSFRFASRRPHRFSNPAQDAKAVVLWVNCVTGAG